MNCDMEPVENYLQTGYSATLSIWNADMEPYDERTEQKTNEELLQMVETEREIMDTSEEMDRSHLETWFITENNVKRTNPREEGLCETKDNVLGLVTEDKEATIGYEELKMLAQDTQAGVNEDGNLPYWENTTERDIHTTYICRESTSYYAPAPNRWGNKQCFCLTSVLHVHQA